MPEPVGADDGDQLAGTNGKRDVFQNEAPRIPGVQCCDPDGGVDSPRWIVLETEQARSRQRLDDALDVVAHHPDVRVRGWVAEAVVVQVGDDLLDTSFLGEALRELG